MKFKAILAVFILTIVVSAQTAPSGPSPADSQKTATPASSTSKTECPCCKDMKDGDKTGSCCSHMQANSDGEKMSCCSGKDAKSCMKGDQSADASCGKGKCCEGKKGCCGKSKDKNEQTAMACCRGNQCGHDHAGMDK